jgi:hypothetical protein
MTSGEFDEFTKYLIVVANLKQRELSPEDITIYFNALSDLSLKQFRFALSAAVKSLKWFPQPSELRELAIPQNSKSADEAWAEVLTLKNRCCGTGKEPAYSTPMVEQACRSVGGLNGIWMAGAEQESYIRHAFIQAYNGLAEREHKDLMIGAPSREEAKHLLDKINKQMKEK